MSYILDALRRADAERERGAVPGLHSQATPSAPATPAAAPRSRMLWVVLGLLAALLLVALFIGLLRGGGEPAVLPAPSPPVHAPAAATAAAPLIVPPPPVMPHTVVPAVPPTMAPAGTAPPKAPPAAAAAKPAEPRITPYAQLPADVKRELPKLTFGGAIYSENAANRMLLVGGLLLHEGDTVAPGLVLEQIRPKTAVLRWKDWRYEMPL